VNAWAPWFGVEPTPGCGQRYAHLVQAGGFGPDNPKGWKPWASVADVNLWLGSARVIFDMVRARWNELITVENGAGKGHDASRSIRAYVTEYEQAYAALPQPKWYAVAGMDGELEQVVRNCQAGACALELLDGALAQAGAPVMPVPYSPPPDSGFGLDGIPLLAIGAALVAVVYFSSQGGRS
jgi:hypothetical protein